MDGKRAMNTTFRSCFALIGVTAWWLPGFFAAGLCQTAGGQDRLRVAIYPAIAAPPQPHSGLAAHAKTDSAFARLSTQISTLLSSALPEESLIPLPPETFSEFLRSRPAFDPFHPDSVSKLCAAFAVQKMVLPVVNVIAQPSQPLGLRVILRWLDGASGEVTKVHASEHRLQQVGEAAYALTPDFDARVLMQALLGAPELIFSQEETVTPLPLPLALSEPAVARSKSRKWWWYLSAAAVVGGGSAYWLLGREAAEGQPKLLPEPPGPPPQ